MYSSYGSSEPRPIAVSHDEKGETTVGATFMNSSDHQAPRWPNWLTADAVVIDIGGKTSLAEMVGVCTKRR